MAGACSWQGTMLKCADFFEHPKLNHQKAFMRIPSSLFPSHLCLNTDTKFHLNHCTSVPIKSGTITALKCIYISCHLILKRCINQIQVAYNHITHLQNRGKEFKSKRCTSFPVKRKHERVINRQDFFRNLGFLHVPLAWDKIFVNKISLVSENCLEMLSFWHNCSFHIAY